MMKPLIVHELEFSQPWDHFNKKIAAFGDDLRIKRNETPWRATLPEKVLQTFLDTATCPRCSENLLKDEKGWHCPECSWTEQFERREASVQEPMMWFEDWDNDAIPFNSPVPLYPYDLANNIPERFSIPNFCFGYINGQLYTGDRHHMGIMNYLLEQGWDWDDLEQAEQAWGWVDYFQVNSSTGDVVAGSFANAFVQSCIFSTDAARIDPEVVQHAVAAVEEFTGHRVGWFVRGATNGSEYAPLYQETYQDRDSESFLGEDYSVQKVEKESSTLPEPDLWHNKGGLNGNGYHYSLPIPVYRQQLSVPPGRCFGYINGKLYVGDRHHMGIMNTLLEEGMEWEDLEAAEQAWGWLYWSPVYDNPQDIQSRYYMSDSGMTVYAPDLGYTFFIQFSTDAGRLDAVVIDQAVDAIENYAGVHGSKLWVGATNAEYAPQYQKKYVEDGGFYKNYADPSVKAVSRKIGATYQEPIKVIPSAEVDDGYFANKALTDLYVYPRGASVATDTGWLWADDDKNTTFCFGYVNGKLYIGKRHHMAIMNYLLESGEIEEWEDLENAEQAWGWGNIYEVFSNPTNYLTAYDPNGTSYDQIGVYFQIRFSTDAAAQSSNETMMAAISEIGRQFGISCTGISGYVSNQTYAPKFDSYYGPEGYYTQNNLKEVPVHKMAYDFAEIKFVSLPHKLLIGHNTYHTHLLMAEYNDKRFPMETVAIGRAFVKNDVLGMVSFDYSTGPAGKQTAYLQLAEWANKEGYLLDTPDLLNGA